MGSQLVQTETYLPQDDEEKIGVLVDFLKKMKEVGRDHPAPRCILSGDELGQQVDLPPEFFPVLLQVAEAMRAGLAVTVMPQTMTLTTQQAADLLGVSRPTLVRILDRGELQFERVGTHRRIRLADVLEFRNDRREKQYRMIVETGDIAGDEIAEIMLSRSRKARAAIGKRRREP